MNLSGNIARLRRERGMTQEALSEVLGVSPQTVSKWENSTTCPDVMLLPAIADVFGVSIDALFGRVQEQRVTADSAIDHVIDQVRRTVTALIRDPEVDGSFEAELERYRSAMQDDRTRSVIENDRDVLYFREKLGALALRKPEAGWNTLFADEKAAKLLTLLADEDFRRAMRVILARRMLTFTLPSLAKAAGATDVQRLEECLAESGLFARRELMIDESPLVYWELQMAEQRLFLIYAVMAFAAETAHYDAVHYCFYGNSQYFTP